MKVRDVLNRVHPSDEHLLDIQDEESFLESLNAEVEEFRDYLDREDSEVSHFEGRRDLRVV